MSGSSANGALGPAVATVSMWESKLAATEPRPDTQAILDTALGCADAAVHLHFGTLLSEMTSAGTTAGRRVTTSGPRAWGYESWADDPDRVVVALSWQNFTFTDSLLALRARRGSIAAAASPKLAVRHLPPLGGYLCSKNAPGPTE